VIYARRRVRNAPAAASAASAAESRFVWTHVRQALQHVVAAGAISPYFAAAEVRRPFQIVSTLESLALPAGAGSARCSYGVGIVATICCWRFLAFEPSLYVLTNVKKFVEPTLASLPK